MRREDGHKEVKNYEKKTKRDSKRKKSKMIKNQAIFKKGGYSLAITALVLAGLIIFNWLFSSLANRFHLEVDMTVGNKNSLTSENIDFIKNKKWNYIKSSSKSKKLYNKSS